MIHLFYLLGVIFFLHELTILRHPKPYLDKIRKISKENDNGDSESGKHVRKKSWSLLNDEEKSIVRLVLFNFAYFVWLVIGCLFASQWLFFVGLTAFGISIGFLRRRLYKNDTMGSLRIIKFDALVSSLLLAFMILNHFHHII